jgi:4-hydroxybenzoate-CoA ligase
LLPLLNAAPCDTMPAVREDASVLDEHLQRRPYNAAGDFTDANVARGRGGKIAFTDSERSISYGELQAKSCQFARALRRLGLRPENRLALMLYDGIDFPVAFWGAIRAGVVVLPLNTLLNAEQYAYILDDSRAAAIVIAPPLVKMIVPILARMTSPPIVIVAGASDDAPDALFDDLIARESAEPFIAPTLSDEVAFWVYTSGSTGEPKGVKHVHTSMLACARLMGQGVLGIGEHDIVFSAAKLSFSYGLGNAMLFPMSVGASSVLLPARPTPDAVFEVMRRYNPSIFYAVPSLYATLLTHTDCGRGAGSNNLRICVSAGEALPAHIGERWRDTVGVDILDGLGSTEMLQTFLSNRPGDIRYGSSGKPVTGYETKIVDEHGRELPDGDVGELVVRGPTAGEGYWNQRAKSRRTFVGEWTFTGDKYLRDKDGYYYCCGRTDDMFKVSGMWVSPFEVEAALVSHEAVLEAAVIGRKDADGLTKPKAFIVLKNGYTANDLLLETLKVHVKEKAGPWKFPRWIDVRQNLPRTATGKLQRFKLRDEDRP